MLEQKLILRTNLTDNRLYKWNRYKLKPTFFYYWNTFELIPPSGYEWEKYEANLHYEWEKYNTTHVAQYNYKKYAAVFPQSNPYQYVVQCEATKPSDPPYVYKCFGMTTAQTVYDTFTIKAKSDVKVNAYKTINTPLGHVTAGYYMVVSPRCAYTDGYYEESTVLNYNLDDTDDCMTWLNVGQNLEWLKTRIPDIAKGCTYDYDIHTEWSYLYGNPEGEGWNTAALTKKRANFIYLGEGPITQDNWAMLLPQSWIDEDGYLHDYLPLAADSHLVMYYPHYIWGEVPHSSTIPAYAQRIDTPIIHISSPSGGTTETSLTPLPTGYYTDGYFRRFVSQENVYTKGDYIENVDARYRNEYPDDDVEDDYWYVYDASKTIEEKGDYIENVASLNRAAYPDDGIQLDFWYIYAGPSTDYRKGQLVGQVHSEDPFDYPSDSYVLADNLWYTFQYGLWDYTKGDFDSVVSEIDYYTYPVIGMGVGYWYENDGVAYPLTEWTIDKEHLINGVNYTLDITNGSSNGIQFGGIASAELSFTARYNNFQYELGQLLNQETIVNIWYYSRNDSTENWQFQGIFTLDKIELINQHTLKITAYDSASYFHRNLNNGQKNTLSQGDLVSDKINIICDYSGAELVKDKFLSNFKSGDTTVTQTPSQYTDLEILQGVAELNCGFFYNTYPSGTPTLTFKQFVDRTQQVRISKNDYVSLKTSYTDRHWFSGLKLLKMPNGYNQQQYPSIYYYIEGGTFHWTTTPTYGDVVELSTQNPFVYQTAFSPTGTWSDVFQYNYSQMFIDDYVDGTLTLLDDKGINVGDIIMVETNYGYERFYVCKKQVTASGCVLSCPSRSSGKHEEVQ